MIKVAFINKFFEIFPRNFKLIFAYYTYDDGTPVYMFILLLLVNIIKYIHK